MSFPMYPMPVSVSTGSYLKKEIPNLGKSRFLNPTTEQVYDTMDQDDSSNLPNRTASSFITPTTDHSTPLYATVDQVESNNLSNNEPQFKLAYQFKSNYIDIYIYFGAIGYEFNATE